ncbi:MAG: sigma-54-dependent Fis family transcriptional regulator [Polyangiaceae bacterium]|jgi:transcriptional regulator with PAS, ATPase and Fis domain|nr:sigma-54-dependent Fis family transcriptional regulator [Polyangiaceae bacterium]
MHDSQAPAAISPVNNSDALDDFGVAESPSGVMRAAEPADDVDSDDADAETEGALALEAAPLPESPEPQLLPDCMHGVIGLSESLVEVYRVIDRVADTTCTILVTGESGTGKELVARAVHRASPRAPKAFVAVNCGAIPEALLESELFGHARGAFTGAHANKVGRIAMAEGGTLFLDEIGEMPMSLQVKLLRVLQAREYSPVGDNRTLKADVRIVAATNVNLENAVQAGTFREDLYYRLNVIHLTVPALRERPEDVPLLMQHFLKKAKEKVGRTKIGGVSRAAAQILADYQWPGNVRELENTIERAVLLCQGDLIEPKDLPQRLCGLGVEKRMSPRLPDAGLDLRNAVESFENQLIRQALERTKWNKKQAATLLGLNRTTLVEMLKRKRINPRAA